MPTRVLVAGVLLAALGAGPTLAIDGIVSSRTYRPEVVGKVGVVAAGRHFAAEAGMRMLARGGDARGARGAPKVPPGGTGDSPLRPRGRGTHHPFPPGPEQGGLVQRAGTAPPPRP